MTTVTLRALSALLHYPSEMLRDGAQDIRKAMKEEGLLSEKQMVRLDPLLFQLTGGDLVSLQEHYVETFDRMRTHSLHLFEHVHGESRDRGQAMVDLRDRYIEAGLEPSTNELPDYLPLFLEYCSSLPREDGMAELAEPGEILALLAARLQERDTPYAAVLVTLCELAGIEQAEARRKAHQEPSVDPGDLEALDAAWEEAEVNFGAPAGGDEVQSCPRAQAMVSRMLMLDPQTGAGGAPARRQSHG